METCSFSVYFPGSPSRREKKKRIEIKIRKKKRRKGKKIEGEGKSFSSKQFSIISDGRCRTSSNFQATVFPLRFPLRYPLRFPLFFPLVFQGPSALSVKLASKSTASLAIGQPWSFVDSTCFYLLFLSLSHSVPLSLRFFKYEKRTDYFYLWPFFFLLFFLYHRCLFLPLSFFGNLSNTVGGRYTRWKDTSLYEISSEIFDSLLGVAIMVMQNVVTTLCRWSCGVISRFAIIHCRIHRRIHRMYGPRIVRTGSTITLITTARSLIGIRIGLQRVKSIERTTELSFSIFQTGRRII